MGRMGRAAYSGYVPLAALCLCAGLGGWIASRFGVADWTLALPGAIGGYFVSRTVMRRVHSSEDE